MPSTASPLCKSVRVERGETASFPTAISNAFRVSMFSFPSSVQHESNTWLYSPNLFVIHTNGDASEVVWWVCLRSPVSNGGYETLSHVEKKTKQTKRKGIAITIVAVVRCAGDFLLDFGLNQELPCSPNTVRFHVLRPPAPSFPSPIHMHAHTPSWRTPVLPPHPLGTDECGQPEAASTTGHDHHDREQTPLRAVIQAPPQRIRHFVRRRDRSKRHQAPQR